SAHRVSRRKAWARSRRRRGGRTRPVRAGVRRAQPERLPMADAADRRREREAYAELAELAGGFIHEIKNHLSTLGLNLQLLAEDFENPETQRERRAFTRVQRLQSECQRLVDVSNDFLRFARIHDLDMRPCSLNEVVTTMLDFFSPTARQAKIAINSYVPADLPL